MKRILFIFALVVSAGLTCFSRNIAVVDSVAVVDIDSVAVVDIDFAADEDSVASLPQPERKDLTGLRIYELWKLAKWKDKDALMELGDRHRYGRGGVDKSMIMALAYYSETDLEVEDYIQATAPENQPDELLIFDNVGRQFMTDFHLEQDREASLSRINAEIYKLPLPLPQWAAKAKEWMAIPAAERTEKIMPYLLHPTDGDAWIMGLSLIGGDENKVLQNVLKGLSPQYMSVIDRLTDKIPLVAIPAARVMLTKYSPIGTPEYLPEAMELYKRVDRLGLLGRIDMLDILKMVEEKGQDVAYPFYFDDLERFLILCPPEFRELYEDPTMPIDEE